MQALNELSWEELCWFNRQEIMAQGWEPIPAPLWSPDPSDNIIL